MLKEGERRLEEHLCVTTIDFGQRREDERKIKEGQAGDLHFVLFWGRFSCPLCDSRIRKPHLKPHAKTRIQNSTS